MHPYIMVFSPEHGLAYRIERDKLLYADIGTIPEWSELENAPAKFRHTHQIVLDKLGVSLVRRQQILGQIDYESVSFAEAETFDKLTDNQLISEYTRLFFYKELIDEPESQYMIDIALELKGRGYRIGELA